MKPKLLPLVALCLALSTLLAFAANWPNFRGPGSSGVSEEKGLPARWSDRENVVWKTPLPGPGASSPITSGDRVFVTCYTGYGIPGKRGGSQKDLQRHLLCLDRKKGTILWGKKVDAKLPETGYGGFITRHGYASSTPATDGKRVYVFFGKSGVLAYDLDGKQLWKVSVGTGTHGWGSASSPVLYKDLVIVNAGVESGAVVALNKANGKEVWTYPGIRRTWGTPALVDGKGGKQELALSVPGKVLGLDPENGKELWRCEGINDYICPSVVVKAGVVYAIGGRSATALAVRAGGRGDVTGTHRLWDKIVGANVPSPVVFGDHLCWVNDNGMAYCLRARDGATVYSQHLRGSGTVYASITIADGKVYAVSRTRGTFVLAAKPKFALLAHNTLKSDRSVFNGSPAVSNGQLLIRSDKCLYCIGKK
jgi:outer membrane protein assembly factor BamB